MWAGIARLRANRVSLLIKVLLTGANEAELDEMIGLVRGRGLSLQLDATITPRDGGDRAPLRCRASGEGVQQMYDRVAAMGRLPDTSLEVGFPSCGVGRLTLAVDPEGDVYPCLQWRRRSFGNVRDRSLAELWRESPERREAAAAASRVTEVLLAASEAVRRFPFCPALALERTGDPFVIDTAHAQQAATLHRVREGLA